MAVLVLPAAPTTLVAVVTVLGLRRSSSWSTEALVPAALGAQVGLVATSWLVIALLPTEGIGETTCPVIEGGDFAVLLALTLACAAQGGRRARSSSSQELGSGRARRDRCAGVAVRGDDPGRDPEALRSLLLNGRLLPASFVVVLESEFVAKEAE